jgi:magnesium transporter
VINHTIEFDFAARIDRPISIDEVRAAIQNGKHCWVDIDISQQGPAESVLINHGLNARVIESALGGHCVGRYDVYEDCLHVSIATPQMQEGRVVFHAAELIITENVLYTLHRGEAGILTYVHENYRTFFQKFAQSLGFLLFEIWDALIESHRRVLAEIENQVEQTQRSILTQTDDTIFERVSEVTSDLLELRKNVLAVREALDHLATHKSEFVSETTQPYLRNMVGTLARLADDLTVEREVLAETLTLYLGIVSHRTNQLLHRLTLVSVIFMPLMFLCGIYGMNLKLPEYQWEQGYPFFWVLVIVIVSAMVALTRARKLW